MTILASSDCGGSSNSCEKDGTRPESLASECALLMMGDGGEPKTRVWSSLRRVSAERTSKNMEERSCGNSSRVGSLRSISFASSAPNGAGSSMS